MTYRNIAALDYEEQLAEKLSNITPRLAEIGVEQIETYRSEAVH